jgi:hypothetical protein
MIPMPKPNLHLRLPPKILPLKYKILNSKAKLPPSKPKCDIVIIEAPIPNSLNSPKLPIINIKKQRDLKSKSRITGYSKCKPRFHDYKPLFHGRNKSYNGVPDDDEEYSAMNKSLRLLNY